MYFNANAFYCSVPTVGQDFCLQTEQTQAKHELFILSFTGSKIKSQTSITASFL